MSLILSMPEYGLYTLIFPYKDRIEEWHILRRCLYFESSFLNSEENFSCGLKDKLLLISQQVYY